MTSIRIIENVGLPCFVKPNNGGSSFGTTKVTQMENMKSAIDKAFMEDNEVIIESFVKGREITCGLLKTKKTGIDISAYRDYSQDRFFHIRSKI